MHWTNAVVGSKISSSWSRVNSAALPWLDFLLDLQLQLVLNTVFRLWFNFDWIKENDSHRQKQTKNHMKCWRKNVFLHRGCSKILARWEQSVLSEAAVRQLQVSISKLPTSIWMDVIGRFFKMLCQYISRLLYLYLPILKFSRLKILACRSMRGALSRIILALCRMHYHWHRRGEGM